MKRHRVLLYNPRTVFYTMPLAVMAIGSYLDRQRYEPQIIDGRLEPDPVAVVLAASDGALCLGVTVLTGAPILDALAVTRAVKSHRPDLPVIWGGWHPSLFPQATLAEAGIDAVVIGQGEETFAQILDRLAGGNRDLSDIPGCVGLDGSAGSTAAHGPLDRPLKDIGTFPAHDYSLIQVERYFLLKKRRQLDYISSQGCRFRCSFCADPLVYRRSWFGLAPNRIGANLEALWQRYHFQDLAFQDETFFTDSQRVQSVAEEVLQRGLRFTWTATMRADQGARLDEAILALAKQAGLRRIMIGLESGSQPMLDRIKKDIKLDQVYTIAETCRRQHIDCLFNFIVGFPNESPQSIAETVRVAKHMRAMSPGFDVAMFYYRPYPGHETTDMLSQTAYQLPRNLDEWAQFDYVGTSGPWVSQDTFDMVEGFKFYQRYAWGKPALLRAPLRASARWRCRRDFYRFPVEKALLERLRPPARLS